MTKKQEYEQMSKLEKENLRAKEIQALEEKLGFDNKPYHQPFVSNIVTKSTAHSAPGRTDEMIISGEYKVINGQIERAI